MRLSHFIDSTLLHPFATQQELALLCKDAIEQEFYAVCVSPYHIEIAHEALSRSAVKSCFVIGFPYGYQSTKSKQQAFENGARFSNEVDIVINFQALQASNWKALEMEINTLTKDVQAAGQKVKWIVESGIISKDQLLTLCSICSEAGVDFIKTSTGVLGAGAASEDVVFIRQHTDKSIEIKASGGIKDKADALALIAAGASRIGTSNGIRLIQ